jgi:Lar family restriction alleviation protein
MTNGEKYKTVEERVKEFKKFCKEKNCEGCPCRDTVRDYSSPARCVLVWLDLEYTEKKTELKPCPFCGKVPTLKTELNACSKPRYYYVACSCGATFTNADCEADAIAMWNRRVK